MSAPSNPTHLILTLAVIAACGVNADEYALVPATVVECPTSDGKGVLLLENGRTKDVVCQGALGSADIITTTVLCQSSDPVALVSLSAYIWVIDAAADPTDNIGICSISEVADSHTQTAPMIGSLCSLSSYSYGGVLTVDFSVSPPVITGAASGNLSCSL